MHVAKSLYQRYLNNNAGKHFLMVLRLICRKIPTVSLVI